MYICSDFNVVWRRELQISDEFHQEELSLSPPRRAALRQRVKAGREGVGERANLSTEQKKSNRRSGGCIPASVFVSVWI